MSSVVHSSTSSATSSGTGPSSYSPVIVPDL